MGDIYTKLMAIGSDPSDRTVSICIARDDNKGFQIDIALPLVGTLIGALAAEGGKLNSSIPEDEQTVVPLSCTSVSLAVSDGGNLMFVFDIEGGSPLPLEVKGGNLTGLAAELSALVRPNSAAH